MVPVAHAYNRSYSEGRDQEDHGLKPALKIVHETPTYPEKIHHLKGLVEWLKW
jgi:hypothetical protein